AAGRPAHRDSPGKTRTKEHPMTSNARPGTRILGSLRSADGKGVVRMEDRFDTDIDDVWSALTDPARLARWLGEIEGDLRLGGGTSASLPLKTWRQTSARYLVRRCVSGSGSRAGRGRPAGHDCRVTRTPPRHGTAHAAGQ